MRSEVEVSAADAGLDVPKDLLRFIRSYTWDSKRSFAGYVADTGAAIYADDWHTEPLVQGDLVSDEEQRERKLAMMVLQAARKWPSNLFEIPLLVGPQLFGVAQINLNQPIPDGKRILPVRSLRDSGFLLRIALRSDEEANHVASLSAYKHCMQSIMHHEGRFTKYLGGFIQDLSSVGLDGPWPSATRLFAAIVRERVQVCEEFQEQTDPLISIEPTKIYRSATTTADIVLMLDVIKRLYQDAIPGEVHLRISEAVPPTLTPLEPQVVQRVLREILWNSFRYGHRATSPRTDVFLDVKGDNPATLEITVEDNFGGFDEDDDMPREITFESWSEYVHRKDLTHGMGYFTLARYARATNGSCSRENWMSPDGTIGARVVVRLGLESRR